MLKCISILPSSYNKYSNSDFPVFQLISSKMVKIAIAGGAGSAFRRTQSSTKLSADVFIDVGQEIIDALLATGKHEITILTRRVSLLHWIRTSTTHLTQHTRILQQPLLPRTSNTSSRTTLPSPTSSNYSVAHTPSYPSSPPPTKTSPSLSKRTSSTPASSLASSASHLANGARKSPSPSCAPLVLTIYSAPPSPTCRGTRTNPSRGTILCRSTPTKRSLSTVSSNQAYSPITSPRRISRRNT
jgi:hypothetical protein